MRWQYWFKCYFITLRNLFLLKISKQLYRNKFRVRRCKRRREFISRYSRCFYLWRCYILSAETRYCYFCWWHFCIARCNSMDLYLELDYISRTNKTRSRVGRFSVKFIHSTRSLDLPLWTSHFRLLFSSPKLKHWTCNHTFDCENVLVFSQFSSSSSISSQ